MSTTILYRRLLRELVGPQRRANKSIIAHFRSILDNCNGDNARKVRHDIENATLFLRSQREHKCLLDRYNPLFDLTAEERIKATARRVGLDMPVTRKN